MTQANTLARDLALLVGPGGRKTDPQELQSFVTDYRGLYVIRTA